MKINLITCIFLLLITSWGHSQSLWEACQTQAISNDPDSLNAQWDKTQATLELNISKSILQTRQDMGLRTSHPSWYEIELPQKNLELDKFQFISTEIKNTGTKSLTVQFWSVGSNGWGASGETKTLKAGESATLKADLRATYPDKTPKLNPKEIKSVRWMFQSPDVGQQITVLDLKTEGQAQPWIEPEGMLDVPEMISEEPSAGKRVRFQLPEDKNNSKYFVLYLPENWTPQKSYPVIFEYPGNIFYSTKACYSTGRPEACAMGYGISEGKNSIWVSLPFINETIQGIAINGFGTNNGLDTLDYALNVINLICEQFGGDRNNLYLCGFSRGSIACGYIGLRNDTIASNWKAIIGCQHYDGSKWNQSNMKEAVLRAPHFKGQAIFQVDNPQEKYQPVVDATAPEVKWTFAKSGLSYHSTTMFLDNRPMMMQLRAWYQHLIEN